MPTVARFSIAPVKGLALEHPDEIDLTPVGVVEDRRFFLVDDTGRLIDGLLAGPMVQVKAHTDPDGTHLRMTFPDGEIVEDDVRATEPVITRMYGRTVLGHVVDGPWAEALEPFAGRRLHLIRTSSPGGTREKHPATLITDGSLDLLGAHLGSGPVDGRRFRMLIELQDGAAHEEDTWIGSRIELGEARMLVSKQVARCAITTQDPDSGVRDTDTLRTIISYRGLRDGENVDFGVYGEVERPGHIRLGDAVRVLDAVGRSA
jgi:MOSC domain-containing protein